MKNKIQHLKIEHFKSIKALEMDCHRINLIIGKPNVGKSNILEAVALYGSEFTNHHHHYLSGLVRYNEISNLFYDQNLNQDVKVMSDVGQFILRHDYSSGWYEFVTTLHENLWEEIIRNRENLSDLFSRYQHIDSIYKDNLGYQKINLIGDEVNFVFKKNNISSVRKYTFTKEKRRTKNKRYPFLAPPYGGNIFQILQSHPNLRKEVAVFFKEYGLELLLDIRQNALELQKKVDDLVYKIPYELIADTLQRMIFHYAAIESNQDAILLFEEPENHAFPPYIKLLAQKMIASKSNQFFIATHSPYLFNTLLEEAEPEEIGVFIAGFEDYETKLTKLTSQDIDQLLDYGMDVFFNLNWFIDG